MELKQTAKEYQKLIKEISKDNNPENLNAYQDGKAVKTLLEQGHPPENIRQTLIEYSPVASKQTVSSEIHQTIKENYAKSVVNKTQDVIKALKDINEFDISKVAKPDAFSEYKSLAQQYFKQPEASLNSNMDANIAFKMLQKGHSPINIEKAILELSPVAKEPGRSPKNYSEYVIGKTVENREKYREKLEVEYPATAKEYVNKKESLEKAKEFIFSPVYQDGRIVRELIEQGHANVNLIKAVTEHSLSVKEDRNQDKYAQYIVNGVNKEINAERKILNFDLATIKNEKPTLEQEYLQEAKKAFEHSPNGKYNNSIDISIAVSLIKNGHDSQKIENTISDLSPAANRPGMALSYPQQVIEAAVQKINYEQERLQKLDSSYPAVAQDYMKYAEQIKSANPGRDYSEYADGKIAARLLRNGCERENVQRALSEISIVAHNLTQEKGWDSERYAKSVVYHAAESISRYEAAKSLEPKENSEIKTPSLKEEYQRQLKGYIDKDTPINMSVDIQITKNLLAQGYAQDEINKTILEASPIAIEAGRNPEKYVEYVQKTVEQPLENQQSQKTTQPDLPERDKRIAELSNTELPAENNKKTTITKDYNIEVAKLITQEKGWKGPESDIKVAQNLLIKGHKEEQVKNAIGKLSPETAGKSQVDAFKYSHQTVKKALTPEVKKQTESISKGKALKV